MTRLSSSSVAEIETASTLAVVKSLFEDGFVIFADHKPTTDGQGVTKKYESRDAALRAIRRIRPGFKAADLANTPLSNPEMYDFSSVYGTDQKVKVVHQIDVNGGSIEVYSHTDEQLHTSYSWSFMEREGEEHRNGKKYAEYAAALRDSLNFAYIVA